MSAELLKAADAGRRVKAIKRAAGAPDTLRGAAVATMDAWRKEVTAQAAAAKTAASSQKASKKASQKAAAYAALDAASKNKLAALDEVYAAPSTGVFRERLAKALATDLSRSEKDFKVGDTITVADRMQKGYAYTLSAPIGEYDDPRFMPAYTPAEMLALGVFEGKYYNDGIFEFPREWYEGALKNKKLALRSNKALNATRADSRQPLSEWQRKGWLHKDDPRGWFQWYCRYHLGRRSPAEDSRQIGRWRSFGPRHTGQIRANCKEGDCTCRPRQRQGLLQWSYPYDV